MKGLKQKSFNRNWEEGEGVGGVGGELTPDVKRRGGEGGRGGGEREREERGINILNESSKKDWEEKKGEKLRRKKENKNWTQGTIRIRNQKKKKKNVEIEETAK